MGRGAWRAAVHGVVESNMTEQLSIHVLCGAVKSISFIIS